VDSGHTKGLAEDSGMGFYGLDALYVRHAISRGVETVNDGSALDNNGEKNVPVH